MAAEMMCDKDTGKAERVMAAILKMDKIDIPVLKQAFASGPPADKIISIRLRRSANTNQLGGGTV
jgi:hypothetical protein